MAAVRRLVIDVLKPHDPPLLTFTEQLAELTASRDDTDQTNEIRTCGTQLLRTLPIWLRGDRCIDRNLGGSVVL